MVGATLNTLVGRDDVTLIRLPQPPRSLDREFNFAHAFACEIADRARCSRRFASKPYHETSEFLRRELWPEVFARGTASSNHGAVDWSNRIAAVRTMFSDQRSSLNDQLPIDLVPSTLPDYQGNDPTESSRKPIFRRQQSRIFRRLI